jgi:hypothetical protein
METDLPHRALLTQQSPHYLSRGRFANADVRLVHYAGKSWLVKDFSTCTPVIRYTLGRWMISRELQALHLLADMPGVPQEAFRIDDYALAYRYIDGKTIAELPPNELSRSFFIAYEKLVKEMHHHGIVHLDLRNSGNVIRTPQNTPAMIDFQSWLFLPLWLPFLARYLRQIDLSGVYKLWNIHLPGTMGAQREQLLNNINRWRKGWIFSNYFGLRRFLKARHTP